MSLTNSLVAAVLDSPAHRLLSGSTALVRYRGRSSGREYTLPVQYARGDDGDLLVMVGRPETKAWWRNFTGTHPADVRVAGEWRAMQGELVRGTEDPDESARLVDAYLARFPRMAHRLPVDLEVRATRAVMVHFR